MPEKTLAEQRRRMDPVKGMIAEAVQYHLLMLSDPDRPELPRQPESVDLVEPSAVSALVTQVRVKTNRGVRYFTVTVSERW